MSRLPNILASYPSFLQWIDGELAGKSGHEKGNPWQEFSKNLVQQTDFGQQFDNYKDNPRKTRDGGWDVNAYSPEGKLERTLFIQSKYKITNQNDLDSIISGFVPLAGVKEGQQVLDGFFTDDTSVNFVIVTLTDLNSGIIDNYLHSGKPNIRYYKKWIEENRLVILDGPQILKIFRDWYMKEYGEAPSQELHFAARWTNLGNVYLGIVNAHEIKRIHNAVGDSIFFENVRDFAGRTDVNSQIAETIKTEPKQFLELNNGIVFSTNGVEVIDEYALRLSRASIVNGCQTTTTIVQTDNPDEDYFVQVKIVDTNELDTSWKVTHAANYQNEINRIDLDLARFIRPQVVKQSSWFAGSPLSNSESVWGIIDVLNRRRVTYKNVRILFIGLFSREPGNMFDVQFTAVRGDLLGRFLDSEDLSRKLFEVVFALHEASERGAERAKKTLEDDQEMQNMFARLLGDTRAPYMQYLTILAICALADINIAERNDNAEKEYDRMLRIIKVFHEILDTASTNLDRAYFIAFEKVASDVLSGLDTGDTNAISKSMHSRITKKDKFRNLFLQVKLGIKSWQQGRDL